MGLDNYNDNRNLIVFMRWDLDPDKINDSYEMDLVNIEKWLIQSGITEYEWLITNYDNSESEISLGKDFYGNVGWYPDAICFVHREDATAFTVVWKR